RVPEVPGVPLVLVSWVRGVSVGRLLGSASLGVPAKSADREPRTKNREPRTENQNLRNLGTLEPWNPLGVRCAMAKGFANPQLLTTPRELAAAIENRTKLLILDLRPAEEFSAGHIPGAVHVDLWGVSL